MKKGIVLSIFFIASSAWAQCPSDLRLFGQIVSYERVGGEIVLKDRFVPIENDDLSSYMGVYQNLKVESSEVIKSLEIAGQEYPLKPSESSFETKTLRLTGLIEKLRLEEVTIKFNQVSEEDCEKTYIGVSGD